MARKHGQHRGLEPYRCADGKIRWRIRLVVQGRLRRFRGLYGTLAAASKARDRLRVQIADGTIDPDLSTARRRTVAEELRGYLGTIVAKLSQKRERDYERWWRGFFGPTRTLLTVTAADIERARARLLAKPVTPATVNRYTDWLRHVFNVAVRQGRLVKNPVLAIERYQETQYPMRQYSLEEERRLAAALGPYAPWMRLAILTNLRRADQFMLRKEWINWEDQLIQIPRTKTRRPRVVPLSREAEAILRSCCAACPESPWVFPGVRKHSRPMSAQWFYARVFKPACVKVGIPPHRYLWHACRHTFGSRAARSGYSTAHIQQAGGWLTEQAAKRYIEAYQEDVRELMEAVSQSEANCHKIATDSG